MAGTGGSKGRRTLTPDERHLWDRVASTTAPLKSSTAPLVQVPSPGKAEEGAPAPDEAPRPRPGASTRAPAPVQVSFAPPEVGPVGRAEAGLDRRTAQRLRKGHKSPEARLDLHGMSAERAHRACLGFLADSQARGLRMVLVITGKGGDGVGRGKGVLRASLPGWLRASPFGHSIVGIYEAHPRHGGSGAFYVYLKRRRS